MISCQPKPSNLVNHWLDSIQQYLLPPKCVLCGHLGKGKQDLCEHCHNSIQLNHTSCHQCGEPMETASESLLVCGICQKNPPYFNTTYAPFLYDGVIKYLVLTLKYQSQLCCATILGNLLAQHLKEHAELPDYIIPVPLHIKRYHQRGFNQAIEIAKIISNILHVPLALTAIEKHKPTQVQSALPASKRTKNMRRAFSQKKPLQARHVAIVDDVMTTGATVNELSNTILKAGIQRVDIWVPARARKS